jgi:site-specific DNA recombinase
MAMMARRPVNSTLAVRPLASAASRPHLAALVTRVSTDLQLDEEGSLKTQLQRLRAFVDLKGTSGEDWQVVENYELPAISGKDSLRSPTMLRLKRDIESGRVNTVCCTAFARVSRSVKDFVGFFEFLNEHEAEFVSLKENCDTTSAMGRFLITMFAALAQLEREQVSERTRDAVAARAERGLFNGGRTLGLDPDPARKRYVLVNESEAEAVRFAFDRFLALGSQKGTVDSMNAHGYRTKAYTSRRGKEHPGGLFRISTLQYLLRNRAYIGEIELDKRKRQGRGDAVVVQATWPGIVDREVFDEVQQLLDANAKSHTNQAKHYPHVYVLSNGLLACGDCGASMEGRSGIGHLGVRYFYYACRNKNCNVRVPAPEIENEVLDRLRLLATSDEMLDKLVAATNTRLQRQLPALQKRKRELGRQLADVDGQGKRVVAELMEFAGKGRSLIEARLAELEEQQEGLELALSEVDEALRHIQTAALTAEPIRQALAQITEIYAQLKPLEQKELFRLLLHKAEVSERKIVLQVRGDALSDGESFRPGETRFERPIRLPGEGENPNLSQFNSVCGVE